MTKTPHEIFDGSDHELLINKDDIKGSFDINIDLESLRQMTQHELEIRDAERTGVKVGYIAGAQKEREEILKMIDKTKRRLIQNDCSAKYTIDTLEKKIKLRNEWSRK
ncbi:MAG: hypothetical protein SFW66_08990 [Gammaproteobacteria bacterium]|nr:hypothetical protein [Gammaproteobacteria bacterium]